MATKLKGLRIKRVALVDEGANPDAHIRFAKRKEGAPDNVQLDPESITEDQANSIVKRMTDAFLKMFKPVTKDAHTFSEEEAVKDYENIMEKEVWPALYAMADSIRSILFDKEKSESDKETLLKTSASEFASALSNYAGSWSSAKLANATIAKSADALVQMRDEIDAIIAKSNGDADGSGEFGTPSEGNNPAPTNEPTVDPEGEAPGTVTKGVTDMKFNTDAMTPEERAQYEDLAKRFGTEEPDTNTGSAGNAGETGDNGSSTSEDNDIYKGLHPTVRAEMEAMHKTIEAMQDRELMEVAKRYTIIGKKPEELMPVLKGLKAAGGTAYDDMISVLDSAVQVVETSGAFSEIGKRGTATNGDDAWKKIETAASEIAKSKPSMLWANAIEEACLQHPELVEEYEKSRR